MVHNEKILTLHPEGKNGVNISKVKYNTIRNFILKTISDSGEISLQSLTKQIKKQLGSTFEGSITWYLMTVKLDMEARGEIERTKNKKPQSLRIKQQ